MKFLLQSEYTHTHTHTCLYPNCYTSAKNRMGSYFDSRGRAGLFRNDRRPYSFTWKKIVVQKLLRI